MKFFSKSKLKVFFLGFFWIVAATGSIVLLIAAVKKNDNKECKGIRVQIEGVKNHYFIDKKDVEKIIAMYEGGQEVGKPISNFDLDKMEKALQQNIWIKSAQIYFDNNGLLQVEIREREPVARIFTKGGSSFYIDSSLTMLPLSDRLSARLPVFTGFPSETTVLHKRDSQLLKDIKTISMEIEADQFLNSMIDQADITLERQFELIPKIGNQVILFGEAADAKNKFRNLKLFYKKVLSKTGWSRYSAVNLQYQNQVVGKIRGADDVRADSLRTVQLMQMIAENTERMAADTTRSFVQDTEKNTTDSSMILKSIQRDESQETSTLPQAHYQEPVMPLTEGKPAEKVKVISRPKVKGVQPSIKKKTNPVKPKQVNKKKAFLKNTESNDY